MQSPDEPLAVSAPLARTWSRTLCTDCGWYHGLWQYLRLFDIASTPPRHAAFYREALGALSAAGHRRVLIAGSADYAMLALVLWACGKTVDVTALDRCETPLALCRWYADRTGATIATTRADLMRDGGAPEPAFALRATAGLPAEALAKAGEGRFDAICTHSLLGRFAPAERPVLAASLRRRLREGGKLVTVNRIAPRSAAETVGFGPEEARAFRDRVVAAARARPDLMLDPDALAADAELYARRYRSHPVHARDELLEIFSGAGFRIERVDWTGMQGRAGGPSTNQQAEYAHLVAVAV